MITRRNFLNSCSVGCLLALAARSFAQEATPRPALTLNLRAEPVLSALLPDQAPTQLWGYNGATPGPLLRLRQGELLQALFENRLPQGSAVHWHGVRIDNAMDGVPGLTQDMVLEGQDFAYDFVVPDAGTYWYHSHNRSWEQVARGLYGALIVDEPNPPAVDHDIVAFIDDWRLNADGSQMLDFDNFFDQAHEGRLGNYAKAIFQGDRQNIKRGARLRLRLINVATDRVFDVQISGLEGKIVAYDGMPLELPRAIETLTLAPAQRVDIIADVTAEQVRLVFPTQQGAYLLGELATQGEQAAAAAPIVAPSLNRYHSPDLANAQRLPLILQGGAMSARMMGMMGGMMGANNAENAQGETQHANAGIWAINDISGMTEQPLFRFKRGQSVIFELINETQFAHAIHLHGHHFQQITPQGLGALRDTILVDIQERIEIICLFDNPGKWLLHCHMLAHQAAGMKTWLQVA